MNIIQAIKDDNLFKPLLADSNGSLDSWQNWLTALRCIYGLSAPRKTERQLIEQCTGQDSVISTGYQQNLLLTGRRSGKSRIASIILAYESCLAGNHTKLSHGETGVVLCVSPTKSQSRIVFDYLSGIFQGTPLLQQEVIRENASGFDLSNQVRIEIGPADPKHIRGYTLLAVCVDEAAFLQYSDEAKVRSDTELIRALRPGLATTKGRLIAISSPYAKRGWCYKTYRDHHSNPKTRTLVWNSASQVMNPTLDPDIIAEAEADDPAAARAEYHGLFRDDIETFISRELVEACIVSGRRSISPEGSTEYSAFCDISGGRSDSAALAIAHRDANSHKIRLDQLLEWFAPFSPDIVVGKMVEHLQRYNIKRVMGDAYSGEFVKSSFEVRGIRYGHRVRDPFSASNRPQTVKPKNVLYRELLPRLTSGEVELLDHENLITQLSNLERRTRSGGNDIIDHPPGQHDDCANVLAGVCDVVAKPRRKLGKLFSEHKEQDPNMRETLRRRRAWTQGRHPGNGQPISELGNPRSYF